MMSKISPSILFSNRLSTLQLVKKNKNIFDGTSETTEIEGATASESSFNYCKEPCFQDGICSIDASANDPISCSDNDDGAYSSQVKWGSDCKTEISGTYFPPGTSAESGAIFDFTETYKDGTDYGTNYYVFALDSSNGPAPTQKWQSFVSSKSWTIYYRENEWFLDQWTTGNTGVPPTSCFCNNPKRLRDEMSGTVEVNASSFPQFYDSSSVTSFYLSFDGTYFTIFFSNNSSVEVLEKSGNVKIGDFTLIITFPNDDGPAKYKIKRS